KSETLRVEDRKKLRDMVCEINQLFGEQNGILRAAETEPTRAPAISRQTYADKLKRGSVTVAGQPNAKQSSEDTKKQLAEKVDVVSNKIGVRGIKKGRNGAVFVECSSKKGAEKLRISVAERMQDAKVGEVKKSNPVVCVYERGVNCGAGSGIRQQNGCIESEYKTGEKLKEDFKVFRFYAKPQDGKRTVKNAVCSVNPKLKSVLLAGKLKIMWRMCSVRDYNNFLHCFKHTTARIARLQRLSARCANAPGSPAWTSRRRPTHRRARRGNGSWRRSVNAQIING
ncbi:hypothetical protein Trydic_g2968, partial [Trypoxylus dichotomus]